MHFWRLIPGHILAGTLIAFQALAGETHNPPAVEADAPQLRALLEQGWAAEAGIGQPRNEYLAAGLYCESARMGSAEGYYRVGLLFLDGEHFPRNKKSAAAFFSVASQLGHNASSDMLDITGPPAASIPSCVSVEQAIDSSGEFDMDHYVNALSYPKRSVAKLIEKLAPRYSVDVKLALAIASVESNFEILARSPKDAQGVMQLIPETALRFNVRNPYDAEQNIRGGLAYLRWLKAYFRGDMVRVIAAYNSGEKTVDRYQGIPPYYETQVYVRRVLYFSGMSLHALLPKR
jgi:TPR repeat protein